MTIGFMLIVGVLIGIGGCFASELVPRLSPGFPKDVQPLGVSLRIWDRSSRWFWWHVGSIVLSGAVAIGLYAKSGASTELMISGGTAVFFGLIALIDLKYHLIPNILTYPALILIVCARLWIEGTDARSLLLGLGFTFGIFGLTAWLQPGNLGGGDIKLAVVIGGLFGFPTVLVALLIGVGAGAVAAILLLRGKGKAAKMAYAPYLCLGALAVLILKP